MGLTAVPMANNSSLWVQEPGWPDGNIRESKNVRAAKVIKGS